MSHAGNGAPRVLTGTRAAPRLLCHPMGRTPTKGGQSAACSFFAASY